MYLCPHCAKQYRHKTNLNRHLKSHLNVRAHECPRCDSKFDRKDHLLGHIRAVHERPAHECPRCDSKFDQQDQLQRHIYVVHEQPASLSSFQCPHCPVAFTRKDNLTAHVKKFHTEKRKRVEDDSPVAKKKQKRHAKKRTAHLADEGEEPSVDNVDDDDEVNTLLRENWSSLKTHTRVNNHSTFINVRWTGDSTPNFAEALTPFFEKSKQKFKIQASHGFVLKKNVPRDEEAAEADDVEGNYRYFHSSERNAGLFERPVVVGNSAEFQNLMTSLSEKDHLEVCRQERPNSKYIVDRITNTSFVLYPMHEHPIGDGERPLPDFILNNKGLVTLVKGGRGVDLYADRKCFFRCLALHKGGKRKALETRANEFLQTFTNEPERFEGVRMSELSACEKMFDVTIEVFSFDEELEAEPVLKCVRRSERSNKQKPLQLLKHREHFSYIKNIGQLTKSFMCVKCTRLFKQNSKLTRHEPTCNGTNQRNTFATGVYRPQLTPLETLHENGIELDPGAVFPYRATYDFESYFEKNDLPKTKKENSKTTVTARHVPLSVSVCSNVPSFTEPKFMRNRGSEQELIDDFVSYLEKIAAHSFILLKDQYADAYAQLDARLASEEQDPDSRIGQSARSLKNTLDAYLAELPVVGFNSGSYDLNLIKSTIFQRLNESDACESQSNRGPIKYIVKNGNHFKAIATATLKWLDITSYLAPGCSYAVYLKAFGVTEEKGHFPYEYLDSLDRLDETTLPPHEAFYSSLRRSNISVDEYASCQNVWRSKNMKTLADFLEWYNNKDVVPFLTAIEVQSGFYRDRGLDMLKDGLGVPGLTLRYLFKTIPSDVHFTLFSKHMKDIHTLLRQQLVGGPSIIFNRYKEKGVSKIRGDKDVETLEGFDANALYLWGIMQDMPTGHPVIRRKNNGFIPCRTGKFGLLAREWLEYEAHARNVRILHQYNVGEKRLGSRNLPVDGWDPVNRVAYQFHGCRFHGCVTCQWNNPFPHPFKPETPRETLFEKTREITEYLREKVGVEVVEMWECEWADQKAILPPSVHSYLGSMFNYNYVSRIQKRWQKVDKVFKMAIGDAEICNAVTTDKLFGLVQCDIEVPDRHGLREHFAEMTPIFKNTKITRADIGAHMRQFAEQNKIMSTPRPSLIGSYFGKQMLFATPLLKWYIQHGLVVSNITLVLEYEPDACFRNFGFRVSEARRRGDADRSKAIIAETYKLLGNSAYGKTVTNVTKHADISFVSDDELKKHVLNPLFKKSTGLSDDFVELEMHKKVLKHDLPLHIGYFVYQYAKLRMLQFYYDCLDKYVDREDFELCEMDTDSLYLVLSTDTLEDAVRPRLRRRFFRHYHEWFPSESCDEHRPDFVRVKTNGEPWQPRGQCCLDRKAFDKRTPGLFKLEYKGDGIVALCSKTYCCFGDGAPNKTSAKGISKRLNNLVRERYLRVLETKKSGSGLNHGFRGDGKRMFTYHQERDALSYFYGKRQVAADGVSTTPLMI